MASESTSAAQSQPLAGFLPLTRAWFTQTFAAPTKAQRLAWPVLQRGASALVVAPTGTGKTLAAFLVAIDKLLAARTAEALAAAATAGATPPPAAQTGARKPARPARRPRTRVLYISPLKALAVDVERNLLGPLGAIAALAATQGLACPPLTVAVRTGDTSSKDRRAIARGDADILITTPESLFLMLTSAARHALAAVETVIIDEVHVLVPNERGAHLALSLARLERLVGRPLQRIALSATQRPLSEVAAFVAGIGRPIEIVDAAEPKKIVVTVELPSLLESRVDSLGGEATAASHVAAPQAASSSQATPLWQAVFARLAQLVASHRSTLIFVNSRRVAERVAQGLNDTAGTVIAYAHHGSVARDRRAHIEQLLKAGHVPAMVATSSLELGIDVGAIELVVQLEAPQNVASALQRLGRAGHQVGATSVGIMMPKHPSELPAVAAIAKAMRNHDVEPSRFLRNPLDVLAQQIVAMVCVEDWLADELFVAVTQVANYANLPRAQFDSLLDMLSGFHRVAALHDGKPQLTYDRDAGAGGGRLRPRAGAARLVIANAGTIADRGLFAVHLLGGELGKSRVGELDEEMVQELRVGETFLLGASSWRVAEITFDRVNVMPAPGAPGKMPFWRGESTMRSTQLGKQIGAINRIVSEMPPLAARQYAQAELGLDASASQALVTYLADQRVAGQVPTDQRLVVEAFRDGYGQHVICVLSPLGARVMAPLAMLAQAKLQAALGGAVDVMWTNDGFAIRLPDAVAAQAPAASPLPGLLPGLLPTALPVTLDMLLPPPASVLAELTAIVAGSTLFAARFREAAARALLLPKRRPNQRTPLWLTRKRAADLLRSAQTERDFPIVVEAYRKILSDVFDTEALLQLVDDVAAHRMEVACYQAPTASPFAASVVFGMTASFVYDGDLPALERKLATVAIDPLRLQQLVGDVDMHELIDDEVMAQAEALLAQVPAWTEASSPELADWLHDRLLQLGDVAVARLPPGPLATLRTERRCVELHLGGELRAVPCEYAARYAAALSLPLLPWLPTELATSALSPDRARYDLVLRFAKKHGVFGVTDLVTQYAVARPTRATSEMWQASLDALVQQGELVAGTFRRRGGAAQDGSQYVHRDVLAMLRNRSAAKWRAQLAPVSSAAFVRFVHQWHGVTNRRQGLDALLDVIEQLQGLPLLASQLETEVLPARLVHYSPAQLDALLAAGEVVWRGVSASGDRDGKVALYLADAAEALQPLVDAAAQRARLDATCGQVWDLLAQRGALFFAEIAALLGGYAGDWRRALWTLVWQGMVRCDGLGPLRDYLAHGAQSGNLGANWGGNLGARALPTASFRSRRAAPMVRDGRWQLVPTQAGPTPHGATATMAANPAAKQLAVAKQLLKRHGLVTNAHATMEGIDGGFSAVYPVLRALDEAGQLRRGLFVAELAALQFATPAAIEALRVDRPGAVPSIVTLGATDCANPYGAIVPWPRATMALQAGAAGRPAPTPNDGEATAYPDAAYPDAAHPEQARRQERARRIAGAHVITIDGAAVAWVSREWDELVVWLPPAAADHGLHRQLAEEIVTQLRRRQADPASAQLAAALVAINDGPAPAHEFAVALCRAGFVASGNLLLLRKPRPFAPDAS